MIGIDLQNRKPIYEQIVERFQTLIVSGVLEPDSQMPSVRSLAMELSINPNTIQKAYSVLEQEGYIYPVKGRGNFVSGNKGLKLKKQAGVWQSLRELVTSGRELDISCEEFVVKVHQFYAEDADGRRAMGEDRPEPEENGSRASVQGKETEAEKGEREL